MTPDLTKHIFLAIAVILVFSILWRLLRAFIYIGLGIAIVTSLPSLLHGQVPPWADSVVPWLQQLARWAWGALRPVLHF